MKECIVNEEKDRTIKAERDETPTVILRKETQTFWRTQFEER